MEPEFKFKLLEFSFPSPELTNYANLTRYAIFLKFCKSFYTLIRGFKILGLILFNTITIWWQIGDSNCPKLENSCSNYIPIGYNLGDSSCPQSCSQIMN
jgi:hypothetical protein